MPSIPHDRVVAPMLLLHGDRDPRVPMYESEQFSEALALRQKKVAYEHFTYAGTASSGRITGAGYTPRWRRIFASI